MDLDINRIKTKHADPFELFILSFFFQFFLNLIFFLSLIKSLVSDSENDLHNLFSFLLLLRRKIKSFLDILIRVLCHVDHEDLDTLKRVSKTIRKAVIEAKKSHFDYSTPKKRLPFRDAVLIMEEDSNSNWDSSSQSDEMEPPNAPIRRRTINRESDLSKISMVLFK
ncbi:PREDICTED: F-box protein At4g05010-like [Camelina sativa]|uniref:F-box protein At4g05010-like n=1 Tax=Camelina sativa TaxID=90675 RepID=A0ABM0W9Y2_CAMSA|nr:PREDICTED: F-box protein At4g05010-like [Camelina sativa]